MADLRGREGRVPPWGGSKILSISCSFWGNLAKSYVGAPPELAPPPRGNPGSATANPCVRGKILLFGKIFAKNCMIPRSTNAFEYR